MDGVYITQKSTAMIVYYTGAIYSSVPTNEFDCETGSATNVGGGVLLDLLFEGGCFITWK